MADITVSVSSPGLIAWGSEVGAVDWGEQSWSGFALSSQFSVGTATASIDINTSVTGTQINLTVGDEAVDIAAEVAVTGSRINFSIGSAVASIPETVTATGTQINLDEGSVTTDFQPDAGWGNNAWGIVPWGEENDVAAAVTGTQINTAIGIETVTADANVSITGSRINLTVGSVDIAADGNVSVNVAEHLINISLNSVLK